MFGLSVTISSHMSCQGRNPVLVVPTPAHVPCSVRRCWRLHGRAVVQRISAHTSLPHGWASRRSAHPPPQAPAAQHAKGKPTRQATPGRQPSRVPPYRVTGIDRRRLYDKRLHCPDVSVFRSQVHRRFVILKFSAPRTHAGQHAHTTYPDVSTRHQPPNARMS